MNSIEYDLTERQIRETAKSLGVSDEKKRVQARKALEAAGKKAVLILLEALINGNQTARHEAAVALEYVKAPSAARALVGALQDDDHDVRWASMKALIALDQDAIEPLLQALIKDFSSTHLREGAKHILNRIKQDSCLEHPLVGVLQALEGIEPTATVPWAAQAAWEELYGPKRKKK